MAKRTTRATTSQPRKRQRRSTRVAARSSSGGSGEGVGGGTAATLLTLKEVFDLAGKVVKAETRIAMYKDKVEAWKAKKKKKGGVTKRGGEAHDASELEKWTSELDVQKAELEAGRAGVPWCAKLPTALWEKIGEFLGEEKELLPFALTCKRFRGIQERVLASKGSETFTTILPDPKTPGKTVWDVTANWCEWAIDEIFEELLIEYLTHHRGASNRPDDFNNEKGFLIEILGFYAGYHGYMDTLQYWENEDRSELSPKCLGSINGKALGAAFGGRLDLLKWAVTKQGYKVDETTFSFAARGGDLSILKYLKNKRCKWDEGTCAMAAFGGHLEALQWLREKRCPWSESTCSWAARGGHLEVLKWARANDCDCNEASMVGLAVAKGHLDVLQWAKDEGSEWVMARDLCPIAAEFGHRHILQWFKEQAGGLGVQWSFETSADTCAHAAFGGHLELLKWLREGGCEWDGATCAASADGGHMEVLQWAREKGCPWDSSTCAAAASRGRLEILKWARENGCPWDELTYLRAVEGGHRDVLEYTEGHGLRLNAPAFVSYVIDFF